MANKRRKTEEHPPPHDPQQYKENLKQMLRDIEGMRRLQLLQSRLLDEIDRTLRAVTQQS